MAYSKFGILHDNLTLRKTASTSGSSITSISSGEIVYTDGGSTVNGNYTWYKVYYRENSSLYHSGYIAAINNSTSFINCELINESVSFSTNYSSGNSLTLSWSSVYNNNSKVDFDVEFTLTDNYGNTFLSNSSSTSYTISNLSSYYSHGANVTFTLCVSYEDVTSSGTVLFSKSDVYSYAYATISLGSFSSNPKITSITQNSDGTFNLSWDAATWNGTTGNLWYYITSNPSGPGDFLGNTSETSLNNITIPAYGSITIYVTAKEGNTGNWSGSGSKDFTFYKPSLSAPKISISPSSGSSTVITKTDNAVLSYGMGTIDYKLYRGSVNNGIEIGDFSNDTYTITESQLNDWGITNQSFFIKAIATITKPTGVITNNSLNKNSNLVDFTYEPHKTILYYTDNGSINGYEECIVYYYTGDTTKGDNGWIECEPYYYTGDTSIGNNGWQICSYT